MSVVNWKSCDDGTNYRVTIGALDLRCNVWWEKGKKSWIATAMFPCTKGMRVGALCSSMAACKKEALKVAREMLEDHYVAVKAEMANFGMEQ